MQPAEFHLALLARHQDRVRALVQALLSDEHATEDVVQDAWVRAIERGPRDPEASGVWFARVARRLALNRLRARGRRNRRERAVARDEAVPSSAEIAARVELERRVLDAIDSLPDHHRSVLRDRYLGELTPTVVARRDGLSIETVKSRLARARAALRKRLEGESFEGGAPWSLALLPLVEGARWTAPAAAAPLVPLGLGTLAVKKIALVTALASMVLIGVWQLPRAGDPGGPNGVEVAEVAVMEPGASAEGESSATLENESPETSIPAGDARERVSATARPDRVSWTVEGRVQLAGNGGLPHVPLEVVFRMFAGYEAAGEVIESATVRAGDDGEFRWELVDQPAVSTVTAWIEHPDYLMFSVPPLTFLAGEDAASFSIYVARRDATLEGVVRSPEGGPVPGAHVHWTDFDVECDDEGAYEMRVAAGWLYSITAVADGFGMVEASMEGLEPGAVGRLDLTLDAELRLGGVVRDESGAPVADARVRAFHPAPEVVTDAGGRYELLNLPRSARDSVLLYARKEGYCQAAEYLDVPGAGHLVQDLILTRGAEVAGRVVDERGQPLAGAEVWIGSAQHSYDRIDVRSDEDGQFVFDAVPTGSRRLTAEHAGRAPSSHTFSVPEGAANVPDLVVELRPGRNLQGVVRDLDGVPLEGIGLSAQRGRDYVNSHARTDADGRFALQNLPPGDLRISAYALGWVRFEELVAADVEELAVVMRPAGRIAGRVVDAATGRPLPSFTIRIVDPILEEGDRHIGGYSSVWADQGKTFAGSDGHWDLGDEELEPGRVTGIEASAPGYAPAVATHVVVAAPGVESEVVLSLSQPIEVAVDLRSDSGGAAVTGARIIASQEERPYDFDRRWTGTTDEAGACILEDVAPGPLWVAIERPEALTIHLGPFEIATSPPRQRLELRIAAGASLHGVTRDDASRASRAGVEVKLFALEVEGVPHLSLERTSGPDGTFRFDDLPPGLYQLSRVVRRGEHTTYELSLKLRIEPETQEIEQDLIGPVGDGLVSGTLSAAFDLPEGVVVSLLQREGELPPVRSTFVVDGRFEFNGIPAGTYLVTVTHSLSGTGKMYYAGSDAEVSEGGRVEVALEMEEF